MSGPLRGFVQHLTTLFLIVTLGACIGPRAEPFAPELKKNYVLAEDLVLTSQPIDPPSLLQPSRDFLSVMTHDYCNNLKSVDYGPVNPFPLPDLGEVERGSRVQVKQVFIYTDFNARVRYGKFRFTDPATREQLTVYGEWEDLGPKLREVK